MASTYSDIESTDALHQYLESNPASSLANVLDLNQQKVKLANVANDTLQTFLDQKAYGCEPVRIFLQQILAGVCLEMTVQSCSKPEWINGWIVYLLEEGEPELMNALDAGVSGATVTDIKATAAQNNLNQVAADIEAIPSGSSIETRSKAEHKRTVSRAEEAMDEAMQEAKRLSELIAAEEAKKAHSEDTSSSETTTAGGPTPTSSQSDLGGFSNGSSGLADDTLRDLQTLPNVESEPVSSFTNFDQLINSQPPTALHPGHARAQSVVLPLTLHNASISIHDDSMPGEKGTIRSKPTVDYLLQVEPATSQHPGWMIARKYSDFETLHEVLRRISKVSGVPEFADRHGIIPGWKNRSKDALRTDLEHYLRDALSFDRLAESEGMKRFLEKDRGLGRSSPTAKQGGFAFPTPAAFDTVGKGMLDVLSAAPKGAAGGGKAILGGVTGVLGGVGSLGQKKQVSVGSNKSAQSSHAKLTRTDSSISAGRPSQELPRRSFTELNETRTPPLPARPDEVQPGWSPPMPVNEPYSTSNVTRDRASSNNQNAQLEIRSDHELHLPPPPSEIPDDWSSVPNFSRKSTSIDGHPRQPLEDNATLRSSPSRKTDSSLQSSNSPTAPPALPKRVKPPKPPITEEETRVAVELFFAVINELYTLSSAWNIRRTLLNAAKNYLLRPGNPSLEAIRVLIQDTMINANTSDTGLAAHILKLRENTMPTEEERSTWPPPRSEEEKTKLRLRARKLLVEKGMPQALTSVMGSAASGEALGRVFDALQVEGIARGLMFALILQGVKAVTQ